MASFVLDPAADVASLRVQHAELTKAIVGRGRARSLEVELGADPAPGHLVLQMLASVALTAPAAGRQVTYGPRAAVELARMDIKREGRA